MSKLVDAATGVLTGQNKIQTQSNVNVQASSSALKAIVIIGAVVLGTAWILRPGQRRRRRKARRS